MSITKDIAIVLSTSDYKDSDKLVNLLCRESGRIHAIARGAKRSKRRFAGGIDIFDCAEISISSHPKSKEKLSLGEFTVRHPWSTFRSSLEKLSFAALCTETAAALTIEHDPDSKLLFNPLFLSLKALDESQHLKEFQAIAAYMILHTLGTSGFGAFEENMEIQSEIQQWYNAMLAESCPIVPNDAQLSELGLNFCVRRLSELTGKRLNSWEAVRQIA